MPLLSNQRHELFAQEVAKGKSASEALALAGYRPYGPNAHRLIKNDKIRERIDNIRLEAAEKTGLSIQYVLEKLQLNLDRAMQAEPVLDSRGKPTGEYRYDGSVANKALELLGKHLGLFKDKVEHSGPGGGPIEVTKIERVIVRAKDPK